MRVLQIGSDRSRRGILYPDSSAIERQKAYGKEFGELDIVGFSLRKDGRTPFEVSMHTHVYPTNSRSKIFYGLDTIRIVRHLPKPDVITVQDPFEAGLLGLVLAWWLKVPLYVQLHTDPFSAGYLLHSVTNHARAIAARIVLARATRIRVVSDRVRESIKRETNPSAPIAVLPIFVDVGLFAQAHAPQSLIERFSKFSHRVLVVSRLEPEKNVALAIDVFAASAPQDSCLIIVGVGSERHALEKLAYEKAISDRVFFEGEQSPIDYYPLASLILVTSRYEGYGLVIVEALAAGKSVLSSDVGVAREMGVIIADEKEFTRALKQWFVDGPREMHLTSYPYADFDAYVRAYCEDIMACKKD